MKIKNIYTKTICVDARPLKPKAEMELRQEVKNSQEVKTLLKHNYIEVVGKQKKKKAKPVGVAKEDIKKAKTGKIEILAEPTPKAVTEITGVAQ